MANRPRCEHCGSVALDLAVPPKRKKSPSERTKAQLKREYHKETYRLDKEFEEKIKYPVDTTR